MRQTARILVIAAFAAGAVALGAAPSGAGAPPTNSFTVVKQVTGPVPAGTTFTVEVTCESQLQPVAQAPTPTEITFDANGDPTSNNVVTAGAGMQCTANETVNGGATSTTYACSIVRGDTDQSGPPFLGNCGPDDNQATFGDVIGDAATITVTNTFPPAPPIQPITPAAQAVQAAPVFTG
ncbi:MAG TPA: hypothetical protein VFW97_09610 [Acidimicrobiia bacterium]|jgi:hypothetical protein|nr:hypothetical protein [Acidimicrobiia bacterium]